MRSLDKFAEKSPYSMKFGRFSPEICVWSKSCTSRKMLQMHVCLQESASFQPRASLRKSSPQNGQRSSRLRRQRPPVSGPRRARPWSGGAAPRRAPGTPRRACETPGFPPATRPARTTCAAVAFFSLRGGLGASEEAEFLSADEKRLDVISTDRCRLHQNHNVPKKRNSVLEVTGLGLRHQRKRPSSVVDHPQLDEISLFLHFTF